MHNSLTNLVSYPPVASITIRCGPIVFNCPAKVAMPSMSFSTRHVRSVGWIATSSHFLETSIPAYNFASAIMRLLSCFLPVLAEYSLQDDTTVRAIHGFRHGDLRLGTVSSDLRGNGLPCPFLNHTRGCYLFKRNKQPTAKSSICYVWFFIIKIACRNMQVTFWLFLQIKQPMSFSRGSHHFWNFQGGEDL